MFVCARAVADAAVLISKTSSLAVSTRQNTAGFCATHEAKPRGAHKNKSGVLTHKHTLSSFSKPCARAQKGVAQTYQQKAGGSDDKGPASLPKAKVKCVCPLETQKKVARKK
jgi:hypothetical protein